MARDNLEGSRLTVCQGEVAHVRSKDPEDIAHGTAVEAVACVRRSSHHAARVAHIQGTLDRIEVVEEGGKEAPAARQGVGSHLLRLAMRNGGLEDTHELLGAVDRRRPLAGHGWKEG